MEAGQQIQNQGTKQAQNSGPQNVEQVDNITVSGGAITSFDELEQVEASHQAKLKAEAKKEADKEKFIEAENKKESKGDKKEANNKESKKTDQKAEKDSYEGPEEEKRAEQDEKDKKQKVKDFEQKDEKHTVKKFKAKSKDREIELDGDIVFKHKVDGKDEEFTLLDAINSFSGHKAVSKRFQELDVARKAYEKAVREFEDARSGLYDKIVRINKLAQENPEMAILEVSQMLGGNGREFLERVYNTHIEKYMKLAQMTPEERAAYQAKAEAEWYRQQLETERIKAQEQEQISAVYQNVEALKRQYGISDDEFYEVGLELYKAKEEGKFPYQIDERLIVETIMADKAWSLAEEIAEEVRPDLLEEGSPIIESLYSYIRKNYNLPKEAILNWFDDNFGKANARRTLDRKMKKTDGETKIEQKPINPAVQDIFSFDSL